MAEFKGTIRLEDGEGLETTMTVDAGRLVAKAGELEIGDWAVGELTVVRRNNDFRINVEGEELIVGMADPVGFSQTLGIRDGDPKIRKGKKSRAPKSKRKERKVSPPVVTASVVATVPPATPDVSPVATTGGVQVREEAPSLWERMPVPWKLAGLGFIVLVAFFMIAPNLLALVLLLAGVATLFLAIASKSESGTGVLPPPFFATTAAILGAISSVLLSLLIMATR